MSELRGMSAVIKNPLSDSKRDARQAVSGQRRAGLAPPPPSGVCAPAALTRRLVRNAARQPRPRPAESESALAQDAQGGRVHTAVFQARPSSPL